MGRQPCCEKVGLKRGPWTIEEDHKLVHFILNNGILCWRNVPKLAGLLRCGKSCRLRWINYLRPDLKRGELSEAEEEQIIQLHARLGNRWSKIASHFPGRTDNEIKNIWNTKIKKRLKLHGLDPITHQPILLEETEKQQEEETDQNNTIPNPSIIKHEENKEKITLETETQKVVLNISPKESEVLELTEFLEDFEMFFNNQEMNSPSSFSQNPSISVGESSSNVSSFQDDSIQQWVESVDSFFSWDCFNKLEDEFFHF